MAVALGLQTIYYDGGQKYYTYSSVTLLGSAGTTMILFQGRLLALIYGGLLGAWLLSSVVTLVRNRAKRGIAQRDGRFVGQALLVFMLANVAAIGCLKIFPQATFATPLTSITGLILMTLGLVVRTWAMVHLGRFFTVEVAVASDQRVIDSGPYRLVRHPSYSGILFLTLGVGLCFGNLIGMLSIVGPMIALMLRRMRVEEQTLAAELGNPYLAYMGKKKRLIPGVY